MCGQFRQPRYIGYYQSIELFASNRANNLEVNGLVRFATSHFTSSNDIVFLPKKSSDFCFVQRSNVCSKFSAYLGLYFSCNTDSANTRWKKWKLLCTMQKFRTSQNILQAHLAFRVFTKSKIL